MYNILLSIFSIGIFLKIYLKLSCGLCKSSKHLVGKVVIITGGSNGIGYETAKDLAERGAKIYIASRNIQRGEDAVQKIRELTGNDNVHYKELDLSSFQSVREFSDYFKKNESRLDILVNNAGAVCLGQNKTEDGLDLVMQTNYFGPFLLTSLLLPLLKISIPSRIVNVSSNAYLFQRSLDIDNLNNEDKTENVLCEIETYMRSKLCNVLMTTELHHRLKDSGVTINVLHPGAVLTEAVNNFRNPLLRFFLYVLMYLFYKTSWEGAQTTIYLCVAPELEKVSGKLFSDCKERNITSIGSDRNLAEKLWNKSESLVESGLIDLNQLPALR